MQTVKWKGLSSLVLGHSSCWHLEEGLPQRKLSPWLSFLSQQLRRCPEKLLGPPWPVSPGQGRTLVPAEEKREGVGTGG